MQIADFVIVDWRINFLFIIYQGIFTNVEHYRFIQENCLYSSKPSDAYKRH